ncbi:MAG: serine/threonine protein kinase, partial [Polyangiaceae bacterium]|nr:serine/threonine protein kinase [Polyangiaceae bacterium]
LFEREAKLASQLSSAHAVRVYDFGASDDGIAYLAMEYLPGADLATVVGSHGPLEPARVIHLGIQACRALEEAHALGLVHRDVKPANLRVTKNGDAWDFLKLVDFGIARRRTHDPDHSTVTGKLRGTPAYMAPEACRGEASEEAVDIYGLGATLYHLLAGAPPFTGDPVEIVSAQLTAKVVPPSMKLGMRLPADLERIVLRCLEKHPGDRYPSALALREALEDCADAGRWSPADAAAFWEADRPAAVARWSAETLA